jgi:mannosyltransferase OCH1-like enzyme
VIFCYWHSTEHDPIRQGAAAWRGHFPDFRVIGDADIEPLIVRHFPRYLETYRRIRIPACRANLARLLALYAWGGLYVDCHCGLRDPHYTRRLLESLDAFELIAFDKHRASADWHVTNSFMFAAQHSELILGCATTAFESLGRHWAREKRQGFSPYSIWLLTGTGNLAETIFDWCNDPPTLKARFAQKVWLIPEDAAAPIVRYRHYSYRKPGMHWSERQTREPLFD